MSILDTRVIDICAVPDWEPDKVILVLTDHLEWGNKTEQGEHLLLLQEKINTYIAFIESGEILDSYPAAKGKSPIIRITGLYELPEQGERFIDSAAQVLKEAGIGLEFVLKNDDH